MKYTDYYKYLNESIVKRVDIENIFMIDKPKRLM